ncbi:MAG: DUF896 domain-containing protein [Butyricicoccaceae bacterium]
MTDEKIARINALAKRSKTEGLTEAEKQEQQALRAEYIADFRKNLKSQLDNTVVVNPDGTLTTGSVRTRVTDDAPAGVCGARGRASGTGRV